jgi:GntR family transcriptional regulator
MSKTQLDTQEMVRLYVEQDWSVRDIATRFGCSYGKIYGLLRARVVLRPSGGRGPRRSTEYVKVAEVMRQRIVAGDWPHGRRILTQRELAKVFDVRQQTVREAVADLRQRGYLVTVPNKGTYVRPPRDWEPSERRDDNKIVDGGV